MTTPIAELLDSYDPNLPLAEASTIPASWYIDERILALERRTTFARTWQLAARVDQVREPGQYVTCEIAGEPILVVRGDDGVLRGFFNVCRHHAAAVMNEPCWLREEPALPLPRLDLCAGRHAQGYAELRQRMPLRPRRARPGAGGDRDLAALRVRAARRAGDRRWRSSSARNSGPRSTPLELHRLHWFERRHYFFDCNWKVFVDNYLDGGYHVPHLHKGLDSVLDYKNYTIENGPRHCLQSSPIVHGKDDAVLRRAQRRARELLLAAPELHDQLVRRRDLDTNFVLPLALDRIEVIFDFYFADVSEAARERNRASMDVGEQHPGRGPCDLRGRCSAG